MTKKAMQKYYKYLLTKDYLINPLPSSICMINNPMKKSEIMFTYKIIYNII